MANALFLQTSAQDAGNPYLDEATTLSITIDGAVLECLPPDTATTPCGPTTGDLTAGQDISAVSLVVDNANYFPASLGSASLLFVNTSVTKDALVADPLMCHPDSDYVLGSAVIYSSTGTWEDPGASSPFGASTSLSVASDSTAPGYLQMDMVVAEVPFQFWMGGNYRLCYSADGTFGGTRVADVLEQTIIVWGIYDHREACKDDPTCMRTKVHRCYLNQEAYNNVANTLAAGSNCVVDYTHSGSGLVGDITSNYPLVSWSEEFTGTYTSAGAVASVVAAACGTSPAPFLCHSDGGCSASDYFKPSYPDSGLTLNFTASLNTLSNTSDPALVPRTVAACFCTYGNCEYNSEFKQQVGLLRYYVSRVCYNGVTGEQDCYPGFTGAAPQHRFSIRVLCPPGGCGGDTTSRIKVVPQAAANDQPSWVSGTGSSVTGCASAQHGYNANGRIVLPDDDNPEVEVITGRSRSDYKIWNWRSYASSGLLDTSEGYDSGFMFDMGATDHEKRNSGTTSRVGGETFDVCYCDDDCTEDGSWFKVGQLRFVPFQLVSAAQSTSSSQEDYAIEYVNQPGVLGFYRTSEDRNVMGLQDSGMLKLVADPSLSITDSGCKDDETTEYDSKYDRDLIWPGPIIDYYYDTAYNEFQGKTNDTLDANKLMFNNGSLANRITVQEAGFLAVCYCSNQEDGYCQNNAWVLAARIMIRGPSSGHVWTVSTYVTFLLEYEGYGLTGDDKIRIIPSDSTCGGGDETYGPSGAYTSTNIKLSCPYPCTEVGEPTSSLNGDIDTLVLGSDTWSCDDQFSDCRTNDIKTITVVNESHTLIVFERVHGLSTGDKITILGNVICNTAETEDQCDEAKLEVLMGSYSYADAILGTNPENAPDQYYSGHIITVHPTNTKAIYIPVGWSTAPAHPRFTVQYTNDRRGLWTRHSKAVTKLEILGTRAHENLRVCWAYPTPTDYPKYISQIGLLTLEDSNAMSNSLITLTSLVKGQTSPWSPMIISFSTAGSETGKQYSQVSGKTRLKLLFTTSTSALYATFNDGSPVEENSAENELSEAKQYICGKLFKELWGSDADLGFPMPAGCYYTVYGTTQEINLVFDAKNGLKGGEDYQMVMTGVAMDAALANHKYAEIYTMDDIDLKPYTSIERGEVLLSKGPLNGAYGTDGVEFYSPDGIKVTSSTASDMMELVGGDKITFALKGEPTGGGIKAGSILRFFLWPLTQWDTADSCTATCTAHNIVTNPCGAIQLCLADSLISNMGNNFIKIVLPASMSTMTDEVSHSITLSGLSLPVGGFFPTKWGVELRKPDDTKPHYQETTGNYFFKEPDAGASVGKLVEFWGDGDQRPFKGDQGNVYYASISLASTLFAYLQTEDAIMEIILPEGYECLYPEEYSGDSPWQAPSTLGVFGTTVPQGTGHAFESSAWTASKNVCTYSLRQNGVIYAGSALMVRITVNNPPTPMKRTNETNRWKVKLSSKGYYNYMITFPAVTFGSDAEMGNYSSNKPVLGKLSEVLVYPEYHAASASSTNRQKQWMRVFFKTEQDTGIGAQIRIVPPTGFSFPSSCTVRDIPLDPFNYYAPNSPGVQARTKRLPGIKGCNHTKWPGETSNSHIAGIMNGGFLEDTYYGFEVEVINPTSYDHTANNTWQFFTTDNESYRVDGNPIEGLAEEDPYFGLYKSNLDVTAVWSSDSLKPSSLNYTTWVEVTIEIPSAMSGASTTLRVTAPVGFLWDATSTFLQSNLGVPSTIQDNVMIWSAQTYLSSLTYAFRCGLKVPDVSPSHSQNSILFEFGHEGTSLTTRYAAGWLEMAPVRTILAADVEWFQHTNLQSPVNVLSFQFETITDIEKGGGIYISGPSGFTMGYQTGKVCVPVEANAWRGSPYETESETCCSDEECTHECPVVKTLPTDTTCLVKSLDGESVIFTLTAGSSGLSAGRYRFRLDAANPTTITPNEDDSSSECGTSMCWKFEARTDISDETAISDAPAYAPAFSIQQRLVEAGIADITNAQAALTGRDDRPLFMNHLVFFFAPNNQMIDPEVLEVRAPPGYIFPEDCRSVLEVRESRVYGTGQSLASGDTAWPTDVEVLSCRGEGPNAYINTDPGDGNGFLADKRYVFRLGVKNPRNEVEDDDNYWVISYGDETSRPFTGYSLWTFKRALAPPLPVTYGASLSDSSVAKLWNPVTFTFAPHNTITGKNMEIRVTAPSGWTIANNDYVSRVLIQPVNEVAGSGSGVDPPDPNYASSASYIWDDAELDCQVDTSTKRILRIIVLSSGRELTADRDYQLTIFVYNPVSLIQESRSNEWILQTFNSKTASPVLPLFRDYITLSGFAVQETARTWLLNNEDPSTGDNFYNGLQTVELLYFEFQFPSKMQTDKSTTPSDVIVIQTPAGYVWDNCAGTFAWEPQEDYADYLPNSPRTCVDGSGELERSTMTILIKEPLDVPAMTTIKFRVNVVNPAKTPHTMLNHWIITHYDGASDDILATTAYESWDIIPQLADVFIELIGNSINKAAGTKSRMAVSFVPINDADQLQLTAQLPEGFDFTGCTVLTDGHEIVSTNIETVVVRAAVYEGVQANIVIDGFTLGEIGGQTTFDLITYLDTGEQMDELLGFTDGFVLPGNLEVLSQGIESVYTLNPSIYPGERNVRMSADATVTFRFAFSRQADPGDLIAVSSDYYRMYADNFVVIRYETGKTVSTEVVSYADGTIIAQIRSVVLLARTIGYDSPSYEVSIDVKTPALPNADDCYFRIELRETGTTDSSQLPIDTNDERDIGFRLVENVEVSITLPPDDEAPPMAEVDIELIIDPVSTNPNLFYLMAPTSYNFTEDCLVEGGSNNEIASCVFYGNDATSGRAIAKLVTKSGGLTAVTDYVVITIVTPGENPDPDDENSVWFLDARDSSSGLQVGWGEDPTGVTIRQMEGAQVVFSGIPEVSTELAVTFYTVEKVEAGGTIRLVYPTSIVLSCDGDFFHPVSLEGDITCSNNAKTGILDLSMPRPLPAGQQAFTVTATPPNVVDDAGGNIFKMLVYTPLGKVVDAAMSVDGNSIQHGLTVSALPLIWSTSEESKQSTISVGFELLADLPEKDPPVISEIVVTVPPNFKQMVTRASHIEMLGDSLPLRSGTWLNVDNARKLKLLLDETDAAALAIGAYRFSFPCMLPAVMPAYNIFHVALCSPNADGSNSTCDGEPFGSRTLTTFPLAGFDFGDVNADASQYMAATAFASRRDMPQGLWKWVLLCLAPFASAFACIAWP